MIIAEKNEGTDIPNTPNNKAILSIQLSLKRAAIIPIIKPRTIAKQIDDIANTIVLGKVSEMIVLTNLPDFLKEVLRYGIFKTN